MAARIRMPWRASMSRRLANIAFSPTPYFSARTPTLLPKGFICRAFTSKHDDDAELFDQLRKLAAARQFADWRQTCAGILYEIGAKECIRLHFNDGIPSPSQHLEALRSVEKRLDADAASPRPRLTQHERETIKPMLISLTRFIRKLGSLWKVAKVALALALFFWARDRFIERDPPTSTPPTGHFQTNRRTEDNSVPYGSSL